MVASGERWLRVAAPATLPDGDGTVEASLEVIEVHEDRSEGHRHRETIAVHSGFASGIEEALADGDSVYLSSVRLESNARWCRTSSLSIRMANIASSVDAWGRAKRS
jgi:hypothetical protein